MERYLIEKRPTWWLLYVIAAVMVALVALIETSVAHETTRITLEVVIVITTFGLMLSWVRANRGRIELSEAAETRRSAVETALANGHPPPAEVRVSKAAWRRPRVGGRRIV